MDKLKMQSENLVDSNIDKIAAVFPNCVTEGRNENGEIIRVVDFELLKQELSRDIVEGTDERYTLNWAGKKQSILAANSPIAKTLRPCRDESVNFDSTQNLYIEGDNLDVLKLLRETYLNKVKMIYIDPPYNTGNDFVYEDDFADSSDSYFEKSKSFDEQGNRLFQNNDANGRFHSDWLSMMFSRLRLAKDLLTDVGVVFISIDDHEQANLKKICDEVFGADNFAAQFPWRKRTAKSDVPFGVSQDYEWVLCYAKSDEFLACLEGGTRKYFETDDFPGRPWRIHDLTKQTSASERPNSYFTMVNYKTGKEYPANPNRTWAVTKETFKQYYAENRIVFPDDYGFLSISKPAFRYFKEDDIAKAGNMFGFIPVSTKLPDEIGMTQDGTKEITEMFDNKVFGYPKPIAIIKYLIKMTTTANSTNNDIILDFFSGSATTAHAVMQLNAEDGGNRKFVMVQLPEKTYEASEAFKAGYKNICEIGKERIRRAGKKIQAENQMTAPNLDVGFRVLKLDTTCMKDVYYFPAEISQDLLSKYESNIKEDRTAEDLLFQVMLDMGVVLSSNIEERKLIIENGKLENEDNIHNCPLSTVNCQLFTIFNVNDNNLICCFDSSLTDDVVTQIAKMKPLYAVFRDSSMESDSTAVNFDQIFSTYSSATVRRVI